MNDSSKPQNAGDKPNADPRTVVNRPDISPPDTTSRPGAGSEPAGKPNEDEDSALESLGKAVSAPVLGAADEDPDAKPER